MSNHTAFMNSIPKFLRRPQERAPGKLKFQDRAASGIAGGRSPRQEPDRTIHGGVPPVQPDFALPAPAPVPAVAPAAAQTPPDAARPAPAPARLPWLARRATPSAKAPAARSEVVDLIAHRGAAPAVAPVTESGDPDMDDDAAFQITLPRGVIRQIRMLAAEEGTTHRAIVLRALRAAGLDIPEGADVDRRAVAAKRRQQA